MNPIIDPFIIYLAGIADPISVLSFIIALVSGAIWLGSYAISAVEGDNWNDKEAKHHKKSRKTFLIFAIVSFVIMVFVPTKDTIIEMEIAKQVTPQNVELVADTIKEATDYVVEEIKRLND